MAIAVRVVRARMVHPRTGEEVDVNVRDFRDADTVWRVNPDMVGPLTSGTLECDRIAVIADASVGSYKRISMGVARAVIVFPCLSCGENFEHAVDCDVLAETAERLRQEEEKARLGRLASDQAYASQVKAEEADRLWRRRLDEKAARKAKRDALRRPVALDLPAMTARERRGLIFALASNGATTDEIAGWLGVTQTRIRQVERMIGEKIEKAADAWSRRQDDGFWHKAREAQLARCMAL